MSIKKKLSPKQAEDLIKILKERFETNMSRHQNLMWTEIQKKIEKNSQKLWSLFEMERTGGEPDVIKYDQKSNGYLFCDCSKETPKDRRSLCYDRKALDSRKENKPKNSVIDLASTMGIELLTEEQYRYLQSLENFDTKTSSWIFTPTNIRDLGGALFADFRYGQVFIYHNGAESYYAARGFRGSIWV
ncbi:uncharacterized protein DUF4256 [Leptospira meyeri]|uniref:Uncharacterized protein DUF4256 n=1 Tax=Leptospira meyeri TaxID=29508 RepID=A0A4R8MKM4_LEPME|nr:DUF4256 domain-containing protein [Leptospira meyeri]EKJ86370.1 PF14066 family protein [Leptospira meyeri serovar Hardjo str. Went 5]TDY67726.1 uncharacterized protein DUF4256 [Leptospira meyeri]TGL52838.1 DUF4256 domain-containing protein [Leptospira meyeri]